MKKYDVCIIGGGAAGSMAAIWAGKRGCRVVLVEKNPAIGRKILATGNGRCNITNKFAKADNYHGAPKKFVEAILNQFDQHETIKFFESLGLVLKEEDRGRMFPRTNQASSVVEALSFKIAEVGVDLMTDSEVKKITHQGDGWKIDLADGSAIESQKLILTTGGKAAHFLGSSGDGLFWARQLGHTIVNIYAALVPVETEGESAKQVQGLKVEAKLSFYVGEKLISSRSGDLLFTHFGISGPAVMSQAGEIAPYVFENKAVTAKIDFFPDRTSTELDKTVADILNLSGGKCVKNALAGVVPIRLVELILKTVGINIESKSAEVSKADRLKIVENLKAFEMAVTKLRPLKEAQVTRGGVSCEEINSTTLESKIVPNLYFAGEVVDVDGDSGGFNLQWAWSSGYVAGTSATK
jgi:predicted Rossmann fold flavoprotein